MESLSNYNSVKASLHRSNFMCIAKFFFFFFLVNKIDRGGNQCGFRVDPNLILPICEKLTYYSLNRLRWRWDIRALTSPNSTSPPLLPHVYRFKNQFSLIKTLKPAKTNKNWKLGAKTVYLPYRFLKPCPHP